MVSPEWLNENITENYVLSIVLFSSDGLIIRNLYQHTSQVYKEKQPYKDRPLPDPNP